MLVWYLKMTICLNMIVKDEAHIIHQTLENLISKIKIDYYVICDTGSTDDTVSKIKNFFQNELINGEIHHHQWKDFGTNRSLALEKAYLKADYILVFDADDSITGDIQLNELSLDAYHLHFGTDSFKYSRMCLVKGNIQWKYYGVLHEFIGTVDKNLSIRSALIDQDYCVISGRTSSRNKDPEKYLKDATILEEAYHQAISTGDDLSNRYSFYCANSYCDYGNTAKAIEWYLITLKSNGWYDERYYSCLKLYELYCQKDMKETGMYYLVESFKHNPRRVEGIFLLIQYYTILEMYQVAHNYYNLIKGYYENEYLNDNLSLKLFTRALDYSFYLPYYMIIVCQRVGDIQTGVKMYNIIFEKKVKPGEWWIKNLLFNSQFYKEHLDVDKMNKYFDIISFDKPVVLIYTGFHTVNWNYTYSKNNALGGSEKAAINVAMNLSKDYHVIITGDVEHETIDNVQFINRASINEIINSTKFKCIIVSRYLSFFTMFKNFKTEKLILWAHDIHFLNNIIGCNKSSEQLVIENIDSIDHCVCLTEWQADIYSRKYPELKSKIKLINNGININNLTVKVPNSFVYTSCAERGLARVIELWPDILSHFPDATLNISSYEQFPKNEEQIKLNKLIKCYKGITHHGRLGEKELNGLISQSEYWLYPCTFPETSCITALEMLMNEVICIYYPICGLKDTMSTYGIQVTPGTEIESILSLTPSQKTELRTLGKEYSMRCSWKNKGLDWGSLICKKIAILNSFPFHYEMFGYILHFAKQNNFGVDIYTNFENDLGWIDFYKGNGITFLEYSQYSNNNNYYHIFLTTDDDPVFKDINIDRVICINHHYTIRNTRFDRYINVSKFINSDVDYSFCCYPIIYQNQKVHNNVVSIVGGNFKDFKYNLINRLSGPIVLNVLTRSKYKLNEEKINNNISINYKLDLNTIDLIHFLKTSNYILYNSNENLDHEACKSSSGALGLSFSTLCKLIISKQTNSILGIKNCIEYDSNGNDPIQLSPVDFEAIAIERSYYIKKFDDFVKNEKFHIPKNIFQTWETDEISPDFQKIIDTWKEYNLNWNYKLYTKTDREQFIKENFDNEVYKTYCKIIPGAYKADLFRYCILYIYGGVYVDIDTICMNNLDKLIMNNGLQLVVPIDINETYGEGNHNIFNTFIASVPKSKIMLDCIHRIIHNVKNGIIPSSKLDFTGPGLLGRAINSHLGLDETSSFIGKEGKNGDILFLKFEKGTEYVKNGEYILFQNKNGNQSIINLYNIECTQCNVIQWTTASEIIKKEIALFMYGQYRSYKLNLENNINELSGIFNKYFVNVFILTDKDPENENEVRNIFLKNNCNICFIKYIDDFDFSSVEDANEQRYQSKPGLGKNKFVAKLMYRKYLINKLKNEYIETNKMNIHIHFYVRLFDTIIKLNTNVDYSLEEADLYGSHDTFYFGKRECIDYLFDFGKDLKLYDEEIWNEPYFYNYYINMDYTLTSLKHTLSPEIQYAAHMFYSNFKYKNVRFDHNNVNSPENETTLFRINHCPYRNSLKNEYLYHCNTPSDINEHLPTLYKYTLECESVFETGVRNAVSSYAFAYGLTNSTKKRYFLNDINECEISRLKKMCLENGINIDYRWENNLLLNLEETFDLTFIDTWHCYPQLKRELNKFSKITNKYIIMHDTTIDEFTGEACRAWRDTTLEDSKQSGYPVDEIKMGLWPAIQEFLDISPDWVLHERFTNNNGLTILKKKDSINGNTYTRHTNFNWC